jgi:HD-GYP domain-containing protein (c-di-GMP phosphodiesterase class II)
MPLSHVIEKMRTMAGTRFDPEVVDAFSAAVAAGDITPPDAVAADEPAETHQEVS